MCREDGMGPPTGRYTEERQDEWHSGWDRTGELLRLSRLQEKVQHGQGIP